MGRNEGPSFGPLFVDLVPPIPVVLQRCLRQTPTLTNEHSLPPVPCSSLPSLSSLGVSREYNLEFNNPLPAEPEKLEVAVAELLSLDCAPPSPSCRFKWST
ncbi:hypothetical protein Nepgr_001099 [Nepenthes gracilis]|uniref:Uncharacterized protein n=1 Tax=Nepenthes gracilis TaxID=150966 RepID=A0AAD3P5G6_NEPGR|nr:hypothetical protein Nepgr_001099 [Nepenthes gracilis]